MIASLERRVASVLGISLTTSNKDRGENKKLSYCLQTSRQQCSSRQCRYATFYLCKDLQLRLPVAQPRGTWVHVPRHRRRRWKLGFVSGFWGLRPQIPTGALPLDPAGGLPSPDPLFCPPQQIPGYAPLGLTPAKSTSDDAANCYTHSE